MPLTTDGGAGGISLAPDPLHAIRAEDDAAGLGGGEGGLGASRGMTASYTATAARMRTVTFALFDRMRRKRNDAFYDISPSSVIRKRKRLSQPLKNTSAVLRPTSKEAVLISSLSLRFRL